MDGLLQAVLLTAAVAFPMIAFARVARDPDRTVARMIAEPAMAGLLVGSLFAVGALLSVPHPGTILPALLSWVLLFSLVGAAIGLLGVVARLLGRIWSDRI